MAGPGDSGGVVDDLVVAVELDDQQLQRGVKSGESGIASLEQAVRGLDATIRKVGEGFGVLSAAAVQMGTKTAAAGAEAEAAIAAVGETTGGLAAKATAAGDAASAALGGIGTQAAATEHGVARVASMLATLETYAAKLEDASERDLRAFGNVRTSNEETAAALGASTEQMARLSALYDAVAAKAEERAAADRNAALAAEQAAVAEERAAVAGQSAAVRPRAVPFSSSGAEHAILAGGPEAQEQSAQIDALMSKYLTLAATTDVTSAKAVAAFQRATQAVEAQAAALNVTDAQLAILRQSYVETSKAIATYAAEQKLAQQGTIQAVIASQQQQAETVRIVGTSSVAAFTQAKVAAEEYIVSLGATTEQLAALDAAEARVISRASQMGIRGVSEAGNIQAAQNAVNQKYANTAIVIAGATDQMARQGEVGGRALKTFIASGAQAAFMFGPEGAVIGAIAVTVLAIVDYFRTADKESESAIARIEKRVLELRQKARGGTAVIDVGVAQQQRFQAGQDEAAAEARLAAVRANSASDLRQVVQAEADLKTARAATKKANEFLEAAEGDLTAKRKTDARDEAQSLATLITLHEATSAQVARARDLQAQFRAELEKTTGADHESIETRKNLASVLKTLETAFEGTARAANKDAKALETARDKSANVIATFSQQFTELQRTAEGEKAGKIVEPFDRFTEAIGKAQRALAALSADPKIKPDAFAAYQQASVFLDQLVPKVVTLRKEAADRAIVDLFADLNKQVAELTATKLDDFDLKIKAQNKTTRERIEATTELGSAQRAQAEAELAQVEAMQKEARQAISSSEAVDTLFRAIDERSADGFLTPDELKQSTEQLDFLERGLTDTLAGLTKGSSAYLEVQKLILAVEKERADLNDKFNKQNPFKTPGADQGDTKQQDNERIARQLRMVQLIGDAAGAALNLAKAFHAVDDATAKALGNIIDIGIGLGKVLSKKDVAGGLAEGLKGITGLIEGLVTESPATTQAHKELAENTLALRDLGKHLGDLLKVSESGKTIATVRGGVEQLLATTGTEGGFHKLEGEGQFLEQATGLSFKEIDALAKEFGITLNGTKQSYQDFLKALNTADLNLFFDTFAGDLEKLDANDAIHGITDPIDKLIEKADLLSKASPIFADIFKGLDLSTLEGRVEARKRLQAKWDELMADPAKFRAALDASGLSLAEFKAQMLDVNSALNEGAIDAQKFSEGLSNLQLKFKADGTSPADQVIDTKNFVLNGPSGDTIRKFLEAAGGDWQKAFQDFVHAALADGVITQEEQNAIDGFQAVGTAIGAAGDAAATAAAAARTAAENFRQTYNQERDQQARIDDFLAGHPHGGAKVAEDAHALAVKSPGFQKIVDNADFTSAEGLKAFNEAIKQFIKDVQAGKVPLTDLGTLTIPEIIDGVIGLGDAATAAAQQMADAAAAISSTFSQIDLDARVFGTSTSDVIGKKLTTLGLSGDVSSSGARDARIAELQALVRAKPTDTALEQIVASLIESIRGLSSSSPEGSGAGASAGGGGTTEAHGIIATATVAQMDQALGIWTTTLSLTREIRDFVARLAASALPAIVAPAVASFAAARGANAPERPPVQVMISDGAVRLEVNYLGPVTQQDVALDDTQLDALTRRIRDKIVTQLRDSTYNMGALRPTS